jgi:hypothetical protein
MGNYVIGVGNYVIVSPSEVGNYKIADTVGADGLQERDLELSAQKTSCHLRDSRG